jgi:hypothetical protein
MEPANWPAPLFIQADYFFFAAFFFAPPFFLPAFFAAFFFMAMVRSPELEWNTRSIPRWIGGWATARREAYGRFVMRSYRAHVVQLSIRLAIRRLTFVVCYA